MRQLLLLLVVLGLGAWAYLHFYGAPAGPETGVHFANPGTYFVLEYVSMPTPHGVIAFEPGREVHFVRAGQVGGQFVVTDGDYEIEMKPSQLTNDLDVAALARKGDESSQRAITAYIARERALYKVRSQAANLRTAEDLEQDRRRRLAGSSPH